MSEIEKLYENANIKQDRMCEWTCKDSEFCSLNCEHYQSMQLYYPPFTAEKQLNLLKWLSISQGVLIKQNTIFIGFESGNPKDLICSQNKDAIFEESLAGLINFLWQSLTEQEKEQIRDILMKK